MTEWFCGGLTWFCVPVYVFLRLSEVVTIALAITSAFLGIIVYITRTR